MYKKNDINNYLNNNDNSIIVLVLNNYEIFKSKIIITFISKR